MKASELLNSVLGYHWITRDVDGDLMFHSQEPIFDEEYGYYLSPDKKQIPLYMIVEWDSSDNIIKKKELEFPF